MNYEDFYRNKRVLITGGLGFIGSSIAQRLLELGADVTIVDSLESGSGANFFNIEPIKDRVNLKTGSITNEALMSDLIKGKDVLFSLAAQTSHMGSMREPHKDLEVNVSGQLQLLEIAKKYNSSIKILFASTRQVYGKPQYLPVNEEHPLAPPDINAIHKIAAEQYFKLYYEVYGIKSCVLRLTNTYGPGMRIKDGKQMFLGLWIKNLINRVPIEIFGDGEQLRDLNYVSDVVDAFLICGQNEASSGKVFNLAASEPTSLKTLAQALIEVFSDGAYSCIEFPKERKKIDIGDYYGDHRRIKSVLGWEPETGLFKGLEKTLSFYKHNFEKYTN